MPTEVLYELSPLDKLGWLWSFI